MAPLSVSQLSVITYLFSCSLKTVTKLVTHLQWMVYIILYYMKTGTSRDLIFLRKPCALVMQLFTLSNKLLLRANRPRSCWQCCVLWKQNPYASQGSWHPKLFHRRGPIKRRSLTLTELAEWFYYQRFSWEQTPSLNMFFTKLRCSMITP